MRTQMIKILNKHFDNIFYYLTITFLAVFLCGVWAPHAYSEDRIDPFKGLRKRLIRDGFSPERIEILFQEDKVSFELKGVTQFFMHNEAKLNYKHFTEKYKIDHAKQYMKSHQETLAAA